jgi:hypothetical protein
MSAEAFVSSDYHVIFTARTYAQLGCVDIDICGQLGRVVWVVAMIWAFIADDQSIPSSSWTNILLHRIDCVSRTRATDCTSYRLSFISKESTSVTNGLCYILFFPVLDITRISSVSLNIVHGLMFALSGSFP